MQPIQNLHAFIEMKLHTVPLNGKHIKRDDKGKKYGYTFPTGWQKKFQEERNEIPSPIGGLLTGRGQLVAIDCDDKKTYELFKALDPTNTAFMDSVGKLDKDGKALECGTILYRHTDDVPASFRTTNGYDLDFYNGTGMVFLPTTPNHTKTTWLEDDEDRLYNHLEQLIEFKEMPQTVISLLELLKHQPEPPKSLTQTGVAQRKSGILGKLFQNLAYRPSKANKHEPKYFPIVTKMLTPKEYRSPLYYKQGHLHPNDMKGSGHMYLFKIACILASDNTVDELMFKEILDYINGLWDNPMPEKDLETTIVSPILTGKSTNNQTGEPYWSYDEHWEEATGVSFITKRDSELVDVFYEPKKKKYYLYNTVSHHIDVIEKKQEAYNHIDVVSNGVFDTKEATAIMENVITHIVPNRDFGYYNEDKDFNLFKSTEALKIMHDPDGYKDEYSTPSQFIEYIERFIPSEQQRTYFLRLIRTKLTTFKYSPVVPYIIGVQGSGKNLLISILGNIIGKQYVEESIGGEQLLDKYNDWLMDKFFVNLNELSETLTSARQKKQAQGLIKLYTGSEEFEVRAMRTGYASYPQTAMFIMTANDSPLTIEDTDRRLYYINTPNTFDHAPQCKASSPTEVYKAIMKQAKDIAYWIATEYTNLDDKEYVRAPDHEGKNEMIFKSLNTSSKIAWALAYGEFDMLNEWLIDPKPIFKPDNNGRVYLKDLATVYEEQSNSDEAESVMKQAMKAQQFKICFGSHNEKYYEVPHLANYDGCEDLSDEEAEDINLEPMRS